MWNHLCGRNGALITSLLDDVYPAHTLWYLYFPHVNMVTCLESKQKLNLHAIIVILFFLVTSSDFNSKEDDEAVICL